MDGKKVGGPGWSLAVENNFVVAIDVLKDVGMDKKVLVFHCMDNGSFFSTDRCGVSKLPRKSGGRYHIEGKLVVATGHALELTLIDQMARVASAVKPGLTVIISPVPRYVDPCCGMHLGDKSEERLEGEQRRLLEAVWK